MNDGVIDIDPQCGFNFGEIVFQGRGEWDTRYCLVELTGLVREYSGNAVDAIRFFMKTVISSIHPSPKG